MHLAATSGAGEVGDYRYGQDGCLFSSGFLLYFCPALATSGVMWWWWRTGSSVPWLLPRVSSRGEDLVAALRELELGDYLVLPRVMVNQDLFFLDDWHLDDAAKRLNVPIRLVDGAAEMAGFIEETSREVRRKSHGKTGCGHCGSAERGKVRVV